MVNCAKKIGVRCFAYFASWIALLPHRGAWYWKGSSCNAGTLRLDSSQLCHGRQLRARLWTARFLGQKVRYCYANGFLFHFRVFSNFLSKLGPFKSAICFWLRSRREATTCSTQEMGRKKCVSWVHIYKSLFFFWFCVNRSCLMRVFPQRFFFKQYAAPSTEAFVWASFHFHNFTQRFF